MMIIDIRNLRKSFKSGREELKVLRGFDLLVEAGSIVTIRGESGSGKSTLLNIIGGLDRADGGTVHAAGFDLNEMDEEELTAYRSNVLGFIFQFHYLLSDFTALENVMLPAFIRGVSKAKAQKTALSLLREVGLAERTEHYPAELSGGERQRVAVARALINNPKLLLADEPTGNLDENNSRMVCDILFTLVKERNTSLVLVSHDPGLAGKGDVQYLLEHGILTSL